MQGNSNSAAIMERMRAIRKMKPGKGMELTETGILKPDYGEVLVNVKACSLCGTDIHIYNWAPPWDTRIKPPRTTGHEVCGDVVEVGGGVKGLQEGDFVSAESHIACNACYQCKMGNLHICRDIKFFGVDIDGTWAEYVVMPEQNAWKNPKDMKPEIATLQESLGNSVYTVSEAGVFGKTVSVFGLGPTGLFAIGLAKAGGASRIMAVGGTELHLKLAKKMGADVLINRHNEDAVKRIMEETDGIGADVLLEMAGSQAAIEQGLKSLKATGKACLLGLPPQKVTVDWSKDIVLKDITIRAIYGRLMFKTWDQTSKLLLSKRIDIEPVITHRLKLEEWEKGIEAAASGQAGKVVMFP